MSDSQSGIGRQSVVGVIGAGAMGAGIAQVAAVAGHQVQLYDVADGGALAGRSNIAKALAGQVARSRMAQVDADATIGRIRVADKLEDLSSCALIIEAVVENLEVKCNLFARLEGIVAPDCILATNTSSLSITAIARTAAFPARIVGMHFFNPAPVMKLVEVISGILTSPVVADRVVSTAQDWGKVAVRAKSTPGFIVNRVARPFYAEALRLYEEQVASPATLDALLVDGAGFRMGPFALMDLIGHDVNYAVTCSVFDAYYKDPRYRPSLAQLELVNAGRLGRKSGYGFFDYGTDAVREYPDTAASDPAIRPYEDFVLGSGPIDGVEVALTDGRTARDRAASSGCPVIVYDLLEGSSEQKRLAFATSPDVTEHTVAKLVATMGAQGIAATRLRDWPGLVNLRIVAMLANEAFEAVLCGVADEAGIDDAMRFGVNYPRGPIGWARSIGLDRILSVIDHVHAWTGDPRYRASIGLRLAAADAIGSLGQAS